MIGEPIRDFQTAALLLGGTVFPPATNDVLKREEKETFFFVSSPELQLFSRAPCTFVECLNFPFSFFSCGFRTSPREIETRFTFPCLGRYRPSKRRSHAGESSNDPSADKSRGKARPRRLGWVKIFYPVFFAPSNRKKKKNCLLQHGQTRLRQAA